MLEYQSARNFPLWLLSFALMLFLIVLWLFLHPLVIGLTLPVCLFAVQLGKTAPTVQQTVIKVEEKKDSRVAIVLKFLWMPALVLMTVVTGYHFPYSLAITVALLLWSTKPKPNSIYDWVEKVGHLSILNM